MCPAGVACDLALTARVVPAPEALALRLVTRVVPGGRQGVVAAAVQLAAALAAKPSLALAGTKRVLQFTRYCTVRSVLHCTICAVHISVVTFLLYCSFLTLEKLQTMYAR